MEDLIILLPVHNRVKITHKFIQSLLSQTYNNYHLVVIDDGSTDGTSEMILQNIPDASILFGDGNLWWAGALQKGFDWLFSNCTDDNTLVLIANDDVTFGSQYLSLAVSELRQKTETLLLSKFSYDDGATIHETGILANLRWLSFNVAKNGQKINCLSTRGLFLRVADIKVIGNLHPKFLPHYLSDYEYTIRASKKGFNCITSDHVFLCPNKHETGFRQFEQEGFLKFIKRYLSNKSALNPIYWSAFILLACHPFWVIPNLFKVWGKFFIISFKQIFISFVDGGRSDI